jgi:Protein of unknown function (DUF2934)
LADISIEFRAHEIFLARGGAHSDGLADWFKAERESSRVSPPRCLVHEQTFRSTRLCLKEFFYRPWRA